MQVREARRLRHVQQVAFTEVGDRRRVDRCPRRWKLGRLPAREQRQQRIVGGSTGPDPRRERQRQFGFVAKHRFCDRQPAAGFQDPEGLGERLAAGTDVGEHRAARDGIDGRRLDAGQAVGGQPVEVAAQTVPRRLEARARLGEQGRRYVREQDRGLTGEALQRAQRQASVAGAEVQQRHTRAQRRGVKDAFGIAADLLLDAGQEPGIPGVPVIQQPACPDIAQPACRLGHDCRPPSFRNNNSPNRDRRCWLRLRKGTGWAAGFPPMRDAGGAWAAADLPGCRHPPWRGVGFRPTAWRAGALTAPMPPRDPG